MLRWAEHEKSFINSGPGFHLTDMQGTANIYLAMGMESVNS